MQKSSRENLPPVATGVAGCGFWLHQAKEPSVRLEVVRRMSNTRISREAPPISKDKARRLGVKRSRRRTYLVSFLLVGSVIAMGGAYGIMFQSGNSVSSTSSFTITSPSVTSTAMSSSSVSTSTVSGTSTSHSSGLRGSSVLLVCSPSPQIAGASSNCSATVGSSPAGTGATPSGTVGFASGSSGAFGAINCATSTSTLVCSVTYIPKLGSEGNHSLTATYNGDSGHRRSSATIVLQVSKRPSSVNVNCSPGAVPVNTQTTCTASVSDTGAGISSVPSGAVTFDVTTSGGISSYFCSLSGGSCSVNFVPAPGKEGPISLPAAYGGDVDHVASKGLGTNALSAEVRPTSASVSCSPSIATSGSQVSCQATVEDSLGSGVPLVPKGNFSFTSSGGGAFSPATCSLAPLTSNSAACLAHYTPALGNTASSQQIGGKYGGDPDHSPASATPFTLQLRARVASISLSCASSVSTVNTPLTCSAKVSDASGTAPLAPTGGVSFSSTGAGSFNPTTCIIHSGTCGVTYTPSPGSEGSATITALYLGDGNYGPSSASIVISVEQRLSSTTVNCASSSVPVNAPTTCTAIVSDSTGVGTTMTPTGVVTFNSAGGTFGSGSSCTLSAGSCSLTFTPSPGSEGTVSVGASYAGDVDHSGGTATPFGISATTRSVTVSVSCSPTPVPLLGSTTCTVTVKDSDAGTPIDPTGTVHFSDNGAGGGFSTTDCTLSGGSCSVTYTGPFSLLPISVSITATYSGDTDHSGGSGTTNITVN
jgi:Bacterial Ig-like domain (group 3)